MAIPWYSSDLSFSSLNLNLTESRFVSEENLRENTDGALNNKNKMWSLQSMRKVIVKSNNIFKLPEREIDKISALDSDPHYSDDNDDYHPYHTGMISRAFLSQRLILMLIGRWPFPMRVKKVTSKNKKHHHRPKQFKHKGHYFPMMSVRNYDYTFKSILPFYFVATSTFIAYVLFMSTSGFFDFFLEWKLIPCCQLSDEHKRIFRENLVIFLLVWGCLLHSTISSFSTLRNSKKITRILNYWNVAADELLLEDVKKQKRFLIIANITYLLFLVLIYFAYSTFRIPIVRDGAELFGMISIRPFLAEDNLDDGGVAWQLRVFGVFIIIYAIYVSRSFLFLFCFKCRLLRALFRQWNVKLVRFLRRPENDFEDDKGTRDAIEKMESQRLLNDMTILLKLVKQTDKMFATVLQAYYAVQLLNMCFELYMLAKIGSREFNRRDDSNRSLDIVTALITLCQNFYFFFTVSLDGAYVGEEASKGLEALRRHAITPNSSIYRKYLIYNLGFVYNQKIAVTGGKYFTIDRPFIITVLGAVLTYFVIILQVGPSLSMRYYNHTQSSATVSPAAS